MALTLTQPWLIIHLSLSGPVYSWIYKFENWKNVETLDIHELSEKPKPTHYLGLITKCLFDFSAGTRTV